MEVEMDASKSIEENASIYFDKSKKARKKAESIAHAIKKTEKRIELAGKTVLEQKKKPALKKRSLEWFERFHWFYSSENFLVIGGRDAGTNETVVKKHLEGKDLYFHADIAGSPHCVVKNSNSKPGESTLKEAAVFAACFSKAWKQGIASADVYSVKPEQISKKAPSGESLGKGAFMIYGKRQWFKKTPLLLAIGVQKHKNYYRVISGPESAVKKHALFFFNIVQGKAKKGAEAKKLKSLFEKKLNYSYDFPLDEIERMLPAGNLALKT